ncbi:MAG: oligosaccharide flippase family protein [Ideonella sp.]|nr:oligosaccharide flippase family protein [Ideonella sp.]
MPDTPVPGGSQSFRGLGRASLTLLAGGAAAQALPLLLGPLLTRLFSPVEFGIYHLFAAVAANLAVVACARFEFALPLAQDEAEAQALRVLCLRLLMACAVLSGLGALGWWWAGAGHWVAWLPLAVAVAGALSLATLWATRAQRFAALATARVLQYGGAALAQVAAGWAGWGVQGLVAAPIAAALLATLCLRLPMGWSWPVGGPSWRMLARKFSDFPLLNTPHAFAGALQDTVALGLVAATLGPAAAGFWGLTLRYLKAPASLVGGAVSQALYPKLAAAGDSRQARAALRQVMLLLGGLGLGLTALLMLAAPWGFEAALGAPWRPAGELAQALAPYIGLHFVASPLGVVTMAWGGQAWALKLALVGQALFTAALALGLAWGGLVGAGWAVSAAMGAYFGYYFWRLLHWPMGRVTGSGSGQSDL